MTSSSYTSRAFGDLRERYATARPFRHVVIDDFLAPEIAGGLVNALPRPTAASSLLAVLFGARKYDIDVTTLDERIVNVLTMLGSDEFTAWLSEITGIADLRIDREFVGGGLHQAVGGSSLPIHADHNMHPNRDALYRRINVLIYLNPRWKLEWGGVLELWDGPSAQCNHLIMPILNRCVIMEVNDTAFHGYERIRAPRGIARNSIAAYYYSASPSPRQNIDPHSTIFFTNGRSPIGLLTHRVRHGTYLKVRDFGRRFNHLRSQLFKRLRK